MLKKGIFGQMFSFAVMAVFISLFVMGTILYSVLGDFLIKQNVDELTAIANKIVEFTVGLSKSQPNLGKELYKANIDIVAESTGTEIVIINEKGEIVVSNSENEDMAIKEEYIRDILKGHNVKYTGNLGGLFKTTMLTVGVPMKQSGSVFGGVILSTPVPGVNQVRSEIFTRFVFIAFAVLIFITIFAYIMSKRITMPLKTLNNAAKSIASGNFKKRVSLDADNEIGELGETFNHMAESIEQFETVRSSFLANISHELRTPMTTITGFVEGIMDGTIPPEQHNRYLSIVLDESKRLSRLVTDLMDIGKMDQGVFKVDMREVDINELIRLCIIKTEKRITEKDINLTVNFEKNDQYVSADKDAIQRVLLNLMDNAIKFTQKGGFIDIRTGMANGKVFVTFQNSGAGIDEEDMKHIFDRFYKSDKSRSLDKTGVGLGLYMVKSIIVAHNEKIWAESEPGEYTRFNFTLEPVAKKTYKS